MTPTDEQTSILDLASTSSANIVINALAGTGKTSTLEMIERAIKTKPILYLVFNKKNAEEAKDRLLSTTLAKTFNSLGHGIWQKQCGSIKLDPKKVSNIYHGIIDETKDKGTISQLWEVKWEVLDAVARARSLGYVPEGKFPMAKPLLDRSAFHRTLDEEPDDLVSDLIDVVLFRSIQSAYKGLIDFNDQIYMPALFGGVYPNFPLVCVDEAQDLSPVNHAMLERLCRNRVIIVGDPWQNIYGFRGAKQRGMAELAAKYDMVPTDLSVSFRCPKAIVEHVHWRVPHFKWLKEGGSVNIPDQLDHTDISDDAAIICRNNAPLFSCALRLLSSGHGVTVAGSDIGPKLVALMKKLGPESLSAQGMLDAIYDWRQEKLAKGSAHANDLADCMQVFASMGKTLGEALSWAEHLFKQRGTIQLLTGHKAKGMEYDTVYHLDPWLCDDREQDQNLRYVISTRSANRLIEIDSDRIVW